VANQNPTSSIDARVAQGSFPSAPDAKLALPVLGSGRKESLEDFRGKVVVLNVFASWCDPCKAEAPILADAQRQLSRHNATIVGVTYLDNSVASEQFVHQQHITYPVLRDVSGNFVRSFGTTGVPETFVINRHGKIQALRRYQLNDTWLKQTLPHILAESA
jgi:cytochrome c biogenesis protein CcmG/thiol:disulfide interchange protein DsbE